MLVCLDLLPLLDLLLPHLLFLALFHHVSVFMMDLALFHLASVCLWWIWMVLHLVQLPHSLSHIFLPFLFFNFNFLTFFNFLFLFFLFNGWDWKLLFSTFNLNHPLLLRIPHNLNLFMLKSLSLNYRVCGYSVLIIFFFFWVFSLWQSLAIYVYCLYFLVSWYKDGEDTLCMCSDLGLVSCCGF